MAVQAIAAAAATTGPHGIGPALDATKANKVPGADGFADMLTNQLTALDTQANEVNALTRSAAMGEPVPVEELVAATAELSVNTELTVSLMSRTRDMVRSIMEMQI